MNLSYLSKKQVEEYKSKLNFLEDETMIFDMLVKNYSIVKMADTLKMSTRSVDRRIQNIKKKMENLKQE